MENSTVNRKITKEIENLISESCSNQKSTDHYKNLHEAILKKYYNAADISIDYHRHRIEMDIVIDDSCYHPEKVNTNVPTLHVNLLFKNLKDFLRSCIEKDTKSIGFYAGLIRSFRKKDYSMSLA